MCLVRWSDRELGRGLGVRVRGGGIGSGSRLGWQLDVRAQQGIARLGGGRPRSHGSAGRGPDGGGGRVKACDQVIRLDA